VNDFLIERSHLLDGSWDSLVRVRLLINLVLSVFGKFLKNIKRQIFLHHVISILMRGNKNFVYLALQYSIKGLEISDFLKTNYTTTTVQPLWLSNYLTKISFVDMMISLLLTYLSFLSYLLVMSLDPLMISWVQYWLQYPLHALLISWYPGSAVTLY
jgi:hypothetical protein